MFAENWYQLLYERKRVMYDKEHWINQCKKLIKQRDELRARLETAERLVLQGGAGHDAIVKKAAELTKQRDALLEACKTIQRARDAFNTADVDFDGAELDKILDDAISLCEK